MAQQRSLVLSLYRQLLREAAKFESYNFRSYALRRVKLGFRDHQQTTTSPTQVASLIEEAKSSLELIRRQVILGRLYPANKLVIEEGAASSSNK